MIEIIRQKLPNTKIVVSELLPRGDYLKQDAMKLNELIYRHINMMQNVEFLKHHNISNSRRQVLYDTKHLNKFVGILLLKQNFLSTVHPFKTVKHNTFFGARLQSPSRKLSVMSPRFDDPRDSLRSLLSDFLQKL